MTSSEKWRVYYDGTCTFCRRCVAWLKARNEAAFEFILFDANADLSKGLQVISPDGTTFFREKGVAKCLLQIPSYSWLGRVILTPVIRPLASIAYRAIASNRKIISRFFCKSGTCS